MFLRRRSQSRFTYEARCKIFFFIGARVAKADRDITLPTGLWSKASNCFGRTSPIWQKEARSLYLRPCRPITARAYTDPAQDLLERAAPTKKCRSVFGSISPFVRPPHRCVGGFALSRSTIRVSSNISTRKAKVPSKRKCSLEITITK